MASGGSLRWLVKLFVALSTLLTDLHYLPSLEYFTCLLPYDTIRLEAHEHYQKQTYRNRCYILSSQQVDRLTVPVIAGSKKIPYQEIAIDYKQQWPEKHWRAICTAYARAPYFAYLAEYFEAVLFRGYTRLFELNLAMLQSCLQLLQLEKEVVLTDCYVAVPDSLVVDARSTILPNTHFSSRTYYQPFCYKQVFGTVFNANLSILDLLFCAGPGATKVLQNSAISHRNST